MFDFEKALLGESMGVPIHEASAFFLEVRTPIKTAAARAGIVKTAGWEDPPDELGVLEGQFEVPVPQAVALMGNCVTQFMKLLSASNIYPNSIRGPYATEVKGQITCNEWDHKRAVDYLVERMTVLAGAPHIPEPDMPPPCTNPIEAARKMIRAEQETIHSLRELYLVLGCNPMRDRVKEISSKCQEHLDKYWMAMPPELGEKPMDIKPPLKLQRHEANETPDMEALESPEFDQAEESVGVESPEHGEMVVAASVKTAASYALTAPGKVDFQGDANKGDNPQQVMQNAGALSQASDAGRMSGIQQFEKGRQLNKMTAGSRWGGVGGAGLGALAGGLAGRALGGGALGTAAGAALGGVGGHMLGKQVGSEIDARRTHKIAAAMVKWAKDESDAELKEKGRQRGVANIAAEHTRERARRGERAGKVLGALGGAAGGAALGRKVVGGPAGTLGGAAIGGLVGRSAGGELGTEVDIARAKKSDAIQKAASAPRISTALDKLAAEERKKGLGERVGGLGGAILGGAAGGTAGAIGGGGVGSLALGAGGMTAGGMAGEALGSRVGRYIDEKGGKNVTNFGKWLYNPDAYKATPEVQKAASAMALWVKTAQPPMDSSMEAEAPMASPTDAPELEPLNYMQAEQLGRQAQEMNEANYHKARAAQAEEGAAQAIQAAQAEADATVQEAQQAIAEATGAEQKAQEMLGVAMQAKDQALQQTETAARIRMANQDLRMKLMEIASQEPDMAAAMNLTQATAQAPPAAPAAGEAAAAEEAAAAPPPPPENPAKAEKEVQQAQRAEDEAAQQAAQAAQATGGGMEVQASANLGGMSPEAFIFGLPDPEGPVGKAPQPRTAPGAAPPEGAPDMNENADGPIGPEGQLAVPSTFFKTAGPLGLAIGAPVGAGVSAFSAESRRREGIGPAQKKVEQLTASQDGSWGQASALARAKMDVADRELQQAHPGRYMAGKALGGAFRGAMGSSALENNLRYLLKG